jgi:heterodisulfide reductase subunit D
MSLINSKIVRKKGKKTKHQENLDNLLVVKHFNAIEGDTQQKQTKKELDPLIKKIYEPNLRNLLARCYQCGSCSSVCQLSKVQKFSPSRIIYQILTGLEDNVLKSGILWDCITCNSCLQNCPELINFAELVRNARYKMRIDYNQMPQDFFAHEGIFLTISEIMSKSNIKPTKYIDWVPEGVEITDRGKILYFVGCLPFFNFEFRDLTLIAADSLTLIYNVEKQPIVVLKEEICCGHDLYWGQGKLESFVELAKKNFKLFKKAGVSQIITSCAECYRTLKYDYPKLFDDFDKQFKISHLIEYIYENWKQDKLKFKKLNEKNGLIRFSYHDPCRLSRFLPKENKILDNLREIFEHLRQFGYDFNEMEHNRQNSLCCGVSCWMNCNEGSKALRYTRLLEAKSSGNLLVSSCPKCLIHLSCAQTDFSDVAAINIVDFSEFLINSIEFS